MLWAMVVLLALLIPLVAVILDSQLGRAIAARLERDRLPGDEALARRLAALEEELERVGRELQRLDEKNEFLQRLLEERKSDPRRLPAGDGGD